jgi:hypothetical protein
MSVSAPTKSVWGFFLQPFQELVVNIIVPRHGVLVGGGGHPYEPSKLLRREVSAVVCEKLFMKLLDLPLELLLFENSLLLLGGWFPRVISSH